MKLEIKNPFRKKAVVSDEELESIRSNIRATQKEFNFQAQKYQNSIMQLQKYVEEAALLDENSMEYKAIQQKAVACRKKADTYAKGMQAAFEILSKNSDYENMLESGMTLSRLAKMLPDPDEAEKLLQKIADISQELTDRKEELDELFKEYGKEIVFPNSTVDEYAEFDALTKAKRESNQQYQKNPPETPDDVELHVPPADNSVSKEKPEQITQKHQPAAGEINENPAAEDKEDIK